MDAIATDQKPIGQDGIASVSKAVEVLSMVAQFGRPVRFSELETQSRFPKGTLYRLVQTLANEGMLNFEPDGKLYSVGSRVLELAHAAWNQFSLADIAKPHLDVLAERIGEVVYLSTLDGGHALSLSRSAPEFQADAFSAAGRIYPAYCTAVGKAMLAQLSEPELEIALAQQTFEKLTDETIVDADQLRADLILSRDRGYATEVREHVRGIISVGVAIYEDGGKVLGGMGIHAPDRRTDLASLVECIQQMRDTATQIAAAAKIWGPPQPLQPQTQSRDG